jgi:hypothetical protein
MHALYYILCLCIVTFLAFLIRNRIVYNIRGRRIQVIDKINFDLDSSAWLSYHCDISYDRMFWDLRKWTYKQWFPNGY